MIDNVIIVTIPCSKQGKTSIIIEWPYFEVVDELTEVGQLAVVFVL